MSTKERSDDPEVIATVDGKPAIISHPSPLRVVDGEPVPDTCRLCGSEAEVVLGMWHCKEQHGPCRYG
jgi:hypothetical protein